MYIKKKAIKKAGVYENFDTEYYEFWEKLEGEYHMLACSKVTLGVARINALVQEFDNRWSGNSMLEAMENTKTYHEYPNTYSDYNLNIIEPVE